MQAINASDRSPSASVCKAMPGYVASAGYCGGQDIQFVKMNCKHCTIAVEVTWIKHQSTSILGLERAVYELAIGFDSKSNTYTAT